MIGWRTSVFRRSARSPARASGPLLLRISGSKHASSHLTICRPRAEDWAFMISDGTPYCVLCHTHTAKQLAAFQNSRMHSAAPKGACETACGGCHLTPTAHALLPRPWTGNMQPDSLSVTSAAEAEPTHAPRRRTRGPPRRPGTCARRARGRPPRAPPWRCRARRRPAT